MNLLDVNVLIYSFRKDAERHDGFMSWLLDLLNEDAAFAISEQVLSSVCERQGQSRDRCMVRGSCHRVR